MNLDKIEETQIYRNYKMYCENLGNDSKAFFESFSIDPLACNPQSLGITKNKTLPTRLYYIFAGKILDAPKEYAVAIEELTENSIIDEIDDPRIYINDYQFEFQNPNGLFYNIRDDIPNGFICVNVWIEELPWLLNEKCETEMFEMAKWWELKKRRKQQKQAKKDSANFILELTDNLQRDFTATNVNFEKLNNKEIKLLFKLWIDNFIPFADKKTLKANYVFGNKRFGNYLWHAFSSYNFV